MIGIVADVKQVGPHPFHAVGEKYVNAVAHGAEAVPIILPATAEGEDLEPVDTATDVLDLVDGLLFPGSASNVAPKFYGAVPVWHELGTDPQRDDTALPLIRAALARDLPLLAVCRGLQELNVALGGSLHQLVHEQPGLMDHREPRNAPRRLQYAAAHGVRLAEGGVLRQLLGAPVALVNSIHAQGIERLASGLVVEATATDGLVEAVRVEGASFALGVQWHPEWRLREDRLSKAIFAAFGAAALAYRARSISPAAAA
ncbi:MAG: gamma-glutamyl-gamma-aminobutyrate hydrolase family protein [Geminicoccaceae bacterium]